MVLAEVAFMDDQSKSMVRCCLTLGVKTGILIVASTSAEFKEAFGLFDRG